MDVINLINTIRDNASEIYRDRIPEATRNNIEAVQEAITDPNNAVVTNEFMESLLNMIVRVDLINKYFSDPFKSLKRGKKPLGDTVEQIYTNFIKAKQYDPTGAELLNRELPDTKAIYFRMNRQDKYKVTASPEQLSRAFSSYDKLAAYIQSIINTLYNSSELDEFVLIKQLIKQAADNNAVKVVEVADPVLSEANGKAFIKAVKTVSGGMAFPNTEYNGYLTAQDHDTVPITTFSRKDEQVLIIDNATDVSLSIDVLASIFNMSVAEFNDTRKIVIDAFPDPSIRAALVDDNFLQVFDDLVTFRSFENGEGLYRNYYLHVWQTLAFSPLVNAVVFKVAADKNSDQTISQYTVTKSLKRGVKINNKNTKVAEGSSYLATLKGVGETDTVTITMGGSDVTSTAYDDGDIVIETVTGNIVISVVDTFTVTNDLKAGVTTSNDATTAPDGSAYSATLTGVGENDTVTVKMGGTDITATAYTAATGAIAITKVTGDIEVKVA